MPEYATPFPTSDFKVLKRCCSGSEDLKKQSIWLPPAPVGPIPWGAEDESHSGVVKLATVCVATESILHKTHEFISYRNVWKETGDG